ncbi:50S ribosomal protein L11 methyltransferase [Roseivirga echinicomitans]|uniref:Ribosomal protein L11 methyltransferase n=1 Tax=Roseivirga echinicomitans TaxID=296218 RepID=A0A150XXP6_9BACT|nr:50S ribosomal protein L11 methyltransferase [Roseivirga echinicomitans]KYG83540.1 50S ribosomal protein L11 methyltransferase [Roseivirga echinicomitans]
MNYIEIKVHCDQPFSEILIAEMGELDFDTFVETEVGFDAYISEDVFSHPALQQLFNNYRKQTRIWYELNKIEKQNWNEEWEKNYDPIEVGTDIFVRATFHESKPGFKHEIIIHPQMSFGTGHHETTHQMLALEMTLDHQGKTVLDVGAGTGILAIMASKLGASEVSATDIDDWCIDNARENFALNAIEPKDVLLGTIDEFTFDAPFDILYANINKNVLLAEMEHYAKLTKSGGHLFLSGFYTHDEADILECTAANGFEKLNSTERKNWAAILLKKL